LVLILTKKSNTMCVPVLLSTTAAMARCGADRPTFPIDPRPSAGALRKAFLDVARIYSHVAPDALS
jgi:hypothetical protein